MCAQFCRDASLKSFVKHAAATAFLKAHHCPSVFTYALQHKRHEKNPQLMADNNRSPTFEYLQTSTLKNDCTNVDSETRQHFIKHLTKSSCLYTTGKGSLGEKLLAPFRLRELTFPAAQPVERCFCRAVTISRRSMSSSQLESLQPPEDHLAARHLDGWSTLDTWRFQ